MEAGAVLDGLPSVDDLAGLAGPELERVLAGVEVLRRRVEAVLAVGVARVDETRTWRADGHRTVRAWEQAALNVSPVTAVRVSRNGAVLAALPVLREACVAGVVPVDVLDVFGRLWANPRVRDQLRADVDLLVEVVRLGWFCDVERVVRRWEALADPDGADRSNADAHASRGARLRGVITDRGGVVVHLGRRSRLFRGSAKDAALLGDRQCAWVGCGLPTQVCETDHTIPYATAGPTDPGNAGRMCGHHNRWKTHGYRTVRRDDGTWDIYRPDGTRIGHHIRPAA